MSKLKSIRYGVVGCGWFAQAAILPAFQHSKRSELAALFSDTADKRAELSDRYQVPAYEYEDYANVLKTGELDAVFIATPNSEHHRYTLEAAHQGVHVLCEKPLAGTSGEAKEMISACREGNVRLMTAYRLHFEAGNLSVVELIRSKVVGEPRIFQATHTNNVKPGNTRLEGNLDGGPLRDIGIYCINAARYVFGDEPTEVMAMSASSDDARFSEVPEMVSAILRFPGERLASFVCGFGESSVSAYRVVGTEGDITLDPGFTFRGAIKRTVTKDEKSMRKSFPARDQIAPEIEYFSQCIQRGIDPEPSGLEGLIDLEIIEGIEDSIRQGKTVSLDLPAKRNRPGMDMEAQKPATEKQPLVVAEAPNE